ncbi:MAG: prenyltransferase [Halanaeroarchaeum sp.]
MTHADTPIRDELRYLLALSRPRFWLYLAGPVLVGTAFGADRLGALVAPAPLALFGYFLLPANVYLYGINDLYDRRIDRLNPKKEDRESRYEGQRSVPIVAGTSLALLVPVAWVVPVLSWPYLAAWALLATGYSVPPVRFKTWPFFDSLSNGLYVLPGAAAYAALAGVHPPVVALVAGWLWAMSMHTFSAIPDVEPDRRAGIETTATRLGREATLWYCTSLWTLSAAGFAILDWRLGALVLVYPALAIAVAHSRIAVDRAYWWFPLVNGFVGMTVTLGGLWRLVDGAI